MELSSLKEVMSKEGVWFTPVYPNGKKCDFRIKCIGRNSEEYRRALHKNTVKVVSGRTRAVEEAVSSADSFVACVVDWEITDNGKEYPCNKSNKEAVYKDPDLKWLTDQISEFFLEDSNFLSEKE